MRTIQGDPPSNGSRPAGRRMFLGALAGALAVSPRLRAETPSAQDPWPALAPQIFPGQVLRDGSALLTIEAPYRAEDAAVVPIALRTTFPALDPRRARKITLVIDANPSPVAAVFTIEPESGIDHIATRVRVDDYTNVHAVAELTDGNLYAVTRYVKASGGCSAPALKQTADSIPLGTLRFREFQATEPGADPDRREAQVMVRHPNYSGMQMDQISRLYIPADFVEVLRIWQGDQLLLTVEGGISISENPAFRFSFKPNEAKTFRVEGGDSEGKRFSGSFPAQSAA
ncbi:MAG: quinoprotein dehydrogenase-associated SoxYZ-like carrier [Rhodopila sp.]|jgi:sulfur-oxidizing protein SoxY|nr:quinoprotein dehydrogenase-associated SoxYZ-like carrier [Rhodopila sp.]